MVEKNRSGDTEKSIFHTGNNRKGSKFIPRIKKFLKYSNALKSSVISLIKRRQFNN